VTIGLETVRSHETEMPNITTLSYYVTYVTFFLYFWATILPRLLSIQHRSNIDFDLIKTEIERVGISFSESNARAKLERRLQHRSNIDFDLIKTEIERVGISFSESRLERRLNLEKKRLSNSDKLKKTLKRCRVSFYI
jgi:aspartokinase